MSLWTNSGRSPQEVATESALAPKTCYSLINEWRDVISELSAPLNLGFDTGLVEADEMAIGKRKYQKGKRQRAGGVAWVQTIL